MLLWLDAQDLSMNENENITIWKAKTPSIINAIGANKPPILKKIEGRNFAYFNKSIRNRLDLSNNIFATSNPLTIFSVVLPESDGTIISLNTSATSLGYDDGSNSNFIKGLDIYKNNYRLSSRKSGTGSQISTQNGNYYNKLSVVSSVISNKKTTIDTFTEDTKKDSINNSEYYPYTKSTIGASDGSNSNSYTFPFGGYIGEIIIFNRDLNQSEVDDVKKYLNSKWNSVNRLFLNLNQNYYYYNSGWNIADNIQSEEYLKLNGMKNITNEQLIEFENYLGKDWSCSVWSNLENDVNIKSESIPYSQILPALNSIQLTGVESATFKWTATGDARLALSVNEGMTYHAFKNGKWIDVTNDMSNAMTASEYSNMTWEQYKLLAGDSNFLKHQYYIPDNSTVDDILITAELMGTNKLANTSDYTTSYDQSGKKITITIKKSGTFFANVLDV